MKNIQHYTCRLSVVPRDLSQVTRPRTRNFALYALFAVCGNLNTVLLRVGVVAKQEMRGSGVNQFLSMRQTQNRFQIVSYIIAPRRSRPFVYPGLFRRNLFAETYLRDSRTLA